MTNPPRPELLAAYFDGECEGRDDLALLKARIEDWLAQHPEAKADLAAYRRLLQLWQETAPPEPAAEQWTQMLDNLKKVPLPKTQTSKPRRRIPVVRVLATVAAALFAALWWSNWSPEPIHVAPTPQLVETTPKEEIETLEVATISEVAIIRVEGADTQTLVVGELPLQGNLELVREGDVILTNIQPAAGDSMLPEVRLGTGSTPFIWARLESEQDEP